MSLSGQGNSLKKLVYKRKSEENSVNSWSNCIQQIPDGYDALLHRVKAAHDYFVGVLSKWKLSLSNQIDEFSIKQRTKKYIAALRGLETAIQWKEQWIDQALQIANALAKGTDTTELFNFIKDQKKIKAETPTKEEQPAQSQKPKKGDSQRITLDLFRKGKPVDEIAQLRSLSSGTVHGHLASFILTGEISVNELVSENKIKTILEALDSTESSGATPVKEKLGNEYSYGEIRAVINYRKWMQMSS